MGHGRMGERARGTTAGVARRLALAAPVVIGAVLAVEIQLAVNADYLPTEPTYRVDLVLHPPHPPARPAGPVELAVLGDSTVAGVGSPTPVESLPALLGERVAALLGRPVHVVGLGVSGARTADLADTQLAMLEGRPVDVVVLVVGSNDVTHVTPPWRLRRSTQALLRRALQRPGVPVVLGGIPEFATTPALLPPLNAVSGLYADRLRAVQRTVTHDEGVAFVDIAAKASPRFLGKPHSMSADGFHPAPLGYGFWADALAPAVARAYQQRTYSDCCQTSMKRR